MSANYPELVGIPSTVREITEPHIYIVTSFFEKFVMIQKLGQSIIETCLVATQLHWVVCLRFALADGKPYKNYLCPSPSSSPSPSFFIAQGEKR